MNATPASSALRPSRARAVLGWTGRVLVGLWALFWTWFNVASLVGEIGEHGIGAWINHGLLAALILGSAVLAYVRPRIGGGVLIALTVAMALVFRGARPEVSAMLLLPPGLGGLLVLLTAPRRA